MPGEAVVLLLLSLKIATVWKTLQSSWNTHRGSQSTKHISNIAYKNNFCTVNPFSGVWCQNPGSISTQLMKEVLYFHGTKTRSLTFSGDMQAHLLMQISPGSTVHW